MRRSAVISEDGMYRYRLDRLWNEVDEPSWCVWIMLNPSTADHQQDDATLRRLIAHSQRWGHDGLIVVNRFAWRTPDPAELLLAGMRHFKDVTGPGNPAAIAEAFTEADRIICGWGNSACLRRLYPTDIEGLAHKMQLAIPLEVIELNRDGSPAHPLYSKKDAMPVMWRSAHAVT